MNRVITFICVAPLALIGAGFALHVLLVVVKFALFL
jgi:hypothetical protein